MSRLKQTLSQRQTLSPQQVLQARILQLNVANLEQKILDGCLMERPGWVRMSIHPTMTNIEVDYICDAIKETAENFKEWSKDYKYNDTNNEFEYVKNIDEKIIDEVKKWFVL